MGSSSCPTAVLNEVSGSWSSSLCASDDFALESESVSLSELTALKVFLLYGLVLVSGSGELVLCSILPDSGSLWYPGGSTLHSGLWSEGSLT